MQKLKMIALFDEEIYDSGFERPLWLSICTESETGPCISRLHKFIERFRSESEFRNEIRLHVDVCEITL